MVIHLPLVVALLQAVALVILLLPLCQGYFGFCQSAVVDEYLRDYDGKSCLIHFPFPLPELLSRQQKLTLTERIMVVDVSPVILGYVHPRNKKFTITEGAE